MAHGSNDSPISEMELIKLGDEIKQKLLYNWNPDIVPKLPDFNWDTLENCFVNGLVIAGKLREEYYDLLKSRQIDHNTLTELAIENNRLRQQVKVLTEKYNLLSDETLDVVLVKALITSKILAEYDYTSVVSSEYMSYFTEPILKAAVRLELAGHTTEHYTILYNLNNILESHNVSVSSNILVAVLERLIEDYEAKSIKEQEAVL